MYDPIQPRPVAPNWSNTAEVRKTTGSHPEWVRVPRNIQRLFENINTSKSLAELSKDLGIPIPIVLTWITAARSNGFILIAKPGPPTTFTLKEQP